MTTAFYSHPDCRAHDMGRGHPECPQRLDAIDDYLLATGLDVALVRHEAPLVDMSDLAHAHGSGYVAELREVLERVQASMQATCREVGVPIVTGDTKVMGKGEIDALVINTTGIALTSRVVRDNGLQVGDRIIVTGTVGDHGLAVMATRNKLQLAAFFAASRSAGSWARPR